MGLAALIAWLFTASIGGYMLRTWVARGGLRRQRATGVGVPPAVVFGHASAALGGLAVWASYVSSGWRPLAWVGVVLICTAICLGICTVTLWTPYPVLPDPAAAGGREAGSGGAQAARALPLGGGAAGQTRQAAAAEPPDAFTVTDEMIASLLDESSAPPRPRQPSMHLLAFIPLVHGFGAITTFLLTVTAALLPVR
jgi:manganese efflux pump family protein